MLLPRSYVSRLRGRIGIREAIITFATAVAGRGRAETRIVAAICEHARSICSIGRARRHFRGGAVTAAVAKFGMFIRVISRVRDSSGLSIVQRVTEFARWSIVLKYMDVHVIVWLTNTAV